MRALVLRKKKSIRSKIIRYLESHPFATNTQIAKGIKETGASVSSVTNRLVKDKNCDVARFLSDKRLKDGVWVRGAWHFYIQLDRM
jgi:hypothetical protein